MLSLYSLGLGSDTFIIAPREVEPVVSKNLRGHRGVIEHTIVSSTDPDYNGLSVRGIHVDVLDNDGNKGYISVVDQTKGYHLMSEDGIGDFTFKLFPTRLPEADIVVSLNSTLMLVGILSLILYSLIILYTLGTL